MKTFMKGVIWGGYQYELQLTERLKDPKCLERYGYKVFSQNDEDGIIQEIFRRIGTTNKCFVEFGVENGLESNAHFLLHHGWHGLWIEGSKDYCKEIGIRFKPIVKQGKLRVFNSFITKENINRLIKKGLSETTPDFLSIDVDGNDWYIWDAISAITPRVVSIEYNGKFPPDYSWKQEYNVKHVWDSSDWRGASLKSLVELGEQKGYKLVGTNISGVNAFFVQKELVKDLFVEPSTASSLYNPFRLGLSMR